MINVNQFLKAAKRIGEIKTVFRFPYVHIICISPSFTDLEQDEREFSFCSSIKSMFLFAFVDGLFLDLPS